MAVAKYHYELTIGDGSPGSCLIRVVTTEGDCGPDLTYQNVNWFLKHENNLFQRKFTETDVVPEGMIPERCLCLGPGILTDSLPESESCELCEITTTDLQAPAFMSVGLGGFSWMVLSNEHSGTPICSSNVWYLEFDSEFFPDDVVHDFSINARYIASRGSGESGVCISWKGYRISGTTTSCDGVARNMYSGVVVNLRMDDCQMWMQVVIYTSSPDGPEFNTFGIDLSDECYGLDVVAEYATDPFVYDSTTQTADDVSRWLTSVHQANMTSHRIGEHGIDCEEDSEPQQGTFPDSIRLTAIA